MLLLVIVNCRPVFRGICCYMINGRLITSECEVSVVIGVLVSGESFLPHHSSHFNLNVEVHELILVSIKLHPVVIDSSDVQIKRRALLYE